MTLGTKKGARTKLIRNDTKKQSSRSHNHWAAAVAASMVCRHNAADRNDNQGIFQIGAARPDSFWRLQEAYRMVRLQFPDNASFLKETDLLGLIVFFVGFQRLSVALRKRVAQRSENSYLSFGTANKPVELFHFPEYFNGLHAVRTGSEGRISVLKRRHGLNRCRYRGLAAMERWVGLGVIADNLIQIGTYLALESA